jgi:hypothetical protein
VLTDAAPPSPLQALQHNLFTAREVHGGQRFTDIFSAPGEARECVEIARRVLEAAAHVPFDRIAVLLRSPATYRAPLEDALRRAKIPAYFASGIPQPDPSGRALLALLKCAEEALSARRFSEYLSLGQVPKADANGAPPAAASEAQRFERPRGEEESLLPVDDKFPVVPSRSGLAERAEPVTPSGSVPASGSGPDPASDAGEGPIDPDAPVTAGQLRSPRRWERLIIDAAVIGGVDRWRRRLQGLEHATLESLKSPTLTEAQQQRFERELGDLRALGAFALPLLETLAALPRHASWGEWLTALSSLATRALRHPRRILAVLTELAPMAPVGPVELREVRAVLTRRLSEVTEPPEGRRYGQVFVATVEQVRGLSFELVFVPGLAERIFPQKVREDPLLPDATRARIDARLETNAQRVTRERVALRLAVGAAESRAVLSWPRIDAEHARPRVPSFYALEAARAVEGALPAYEALQRHAEQSGRARLAWPAPRLAASAIDDTEYDLAVLDEILSSGEEVKGRARYLVEVSPHLARALRSRYAKWSQSSWTFADGLVKPDAQARAGLEAHQFSARPYSPTALEQYAACPYKFFLSAIHRLSPLEIPAEIEELGPLEKGSMTHAVHYTLLSELREAGVKVSPATLEPTVFKRLDEVIARVTAEYADDFVPAIERVWNDGIEVMRADLREWLRRVAADVQWEPWRFELSFGLGERRDQDPSSVPKPVPLSQGVQLRGSIDLVERSAEGHLRATDYKTGKARVKEGNVVGGGRHLQPVLYALVLEQLFPEVKVDSGQLFYCTQVGGFSVVPTPLDGLAREHLGRVMLAIRSALEQGFFPAMPEPDECRWCDFRPVCGPEEERRIRLTRKGLRPETRDLLAVRELP